MIISMLLAGCTTVYIRGNDNVVEAEAAGTEFEVESNVDDDSNTEVK